MKILMIGDVVADVGCSFLMQRLPDIKRQYDIDLVIANGENSADGNGITPYSADRLQTAGVDVITTGNHAFKRYEILEYMDRTAHVIRPANFKDANGSGVYIYDGGSFQVGVINLMGQSFMEPVGCPFETIDAILAKLDCKMTIVDLHCEATGEMKALGYYLQGRVSAVVGTHTHIQTADEQILGNYTGYITDVGMTGPSESVLGIAPECVINRLRTHMPVRFIVAEGACHMDGVVLTVERDGKCTAIERLHIL